MGFARELNAVGPLINETELLFPITYFLFLFSLFVQTRQKIEFHKNGMCDVSDERNRRNQEVKKKRTE